MQKLRGRFLYLFKHEISLNRILRPQSQLDTENRQQNFWPVAMLSGALHEMPCL